MTARKSIAVFLGAVLLFLVCQSLRVSLTGSRAAPPPPPPEAAALTALGVVAQRLAATAVAQETPPGPAGPRAA